MPPYIIALIVIAAVIILSILDKKHNKDEQSEKPTYHYTRKRFFLTRAEHAFYDALAQAVGDEFLIFAQVHLPTILDPQIGYAWSALAHINQKSVDFVLCDKEYISPQLAIELDDKSHERPDRQERDREVERILQEAGIPLLRIENHGTFDPNEIAAKIRELTLKTF